MPEKTKTVSESTSSATELKLDDESLVRDAITIATPSGKSKGKRQKAKV